MHPMQQMIIFDDHSKLVWGKDRHHFGTNHKIFQLTKAKTGEIIRLYKQTVMSRSRDIVALRLSTEPDTPTS